LVDLKKSCGSDDEDEMGRSGRRQRLRGGGANQGGAFLPSTPRRVILSNIAVGCELSLEEGDITAFHGAEAVIGARSAGEAGEAAGQRHIGARA
jgi:hypothetical protein